MVYSFFEFFLFLFCFTWVGVNLERGQFASAFVIALNIYCVSSAFVFALNVSIFFSSLIVEVLCLIWVSLESWTIVKTIVVWL